MVFYFFVIILAMNRLNHSYFYTPTKQEINHSLHITWAGHRECPPNHSVGPRVLDDYSFILVVNGEGSFIKNRTQLKVNKGDMIILSPGVRHYYFTDPDDPWEIYWVAFNGEIVKSIFQVLSFDPEVPVLRNCYSHSLRTMFESIVLEMKKNIVMPLKINGYLYLMFSLLRGNDVANNVRLPDLKIEKNEKISKVITFIELNYYNDISVDLISEHVSVSRSHLTRIFKKSTGYSLKQYIIKFRIDKAKSLLLDTDLSMIEIAHSVGIEDAYYFSRLFKEQEGVAPTQFKKDNII
jgi:AraC family transcriptional regulator, arabinose operon regulatory protein